MTNVIGAGVSLKGVYVEDFMFSFNVSGTVVQADLGKAVSLDTTAANTVKLAADGDPILGRLETLENRLNEGIQVGAIALKGSFKFPVKSGETVIVGDVIQGAGSGEVKALAVTSDTNTNAGAIKHASHDRSNVVVEVGTGFAVAILL